jgi:hypothetical protein
MDSARRQAAFDEVGRPQPRVVVFGHCGIRGTCSVRFLLWVIPTNGQCDLKPRSQTAISNDDLKTNRFVMRVDPRDSGFSK